MKKLICVLLTLVLMLCLSSAAFAEGAEKYGSMMELLEHWEEVGFPDDIGSIYSTDGTYGNMTVQIVGDNFEARAEEIRNMLADPDSVTFEQGQFTDKQLHEISAEIREQYMTEGSGITNVTAGWGRSGGFGPSGQEMRVVVSADEDKVIELAQTLGQRYGDAVIVQPSSMDQTQADPNEAVGEPDPGETAAEPAQELITPVPATDTDPGMSEGAGRISEKTESTILSITFIALGALAAFLIIFFRRRKRSVKK